MKPENTLSLDRVRGGARSAGRPGQQVGEEDQRDDEEADRPAVSGGGQS